MLRTLYMLFLGLILLLAATALGLYFYWQQLLPHFAEGWLQAYNWQINEIRGTAPTSDGWHIDYLELQKTSPAIADSVQTDTLRFNQLRLSWNLNELFNQQRLQSVELDRADISIYQQSTKEPPQTLDLQSWFATAYIRQIPAERIHLEQVNLQLHAGETNIGLSSSASLIHDRPEMQSQLNWQTELTNFSPLPALTSLQLTLDTNIRTSAELTELENLHLDLQHQQQALFSSKGSLTLGEQAITGTTDTAAIHLQAEHQLKLAAARSLLQQLQPELQLPELSGLFSFSGNTYLQSIINPEAIWKSLQPVSEQNFQLQLDPFPLAEINPSGALPEGNLQLQLNGQLHADNQQINIQLADSSRIEAQALQHESFSAQNLSVIPVTPLQLSLPVPMLFAPTTQETLDKSQNILLPAMTFTISTDALQLPVNLTDKTEHWQLNHSPLRLETTPINLCIYACQQQPRIKSLNGEVSLQQLSISGAAYELPALNLQSAFRYQTTDSEQSLQQTFTAILSDPLLHTGQLTLKGKSETQIPADKASVTSAHWRFAIADLQGIENLLRRYAPSLPPELSISAGKLFHRGALHATKGQTALRLQQDISDLDGQYQQNRWLGASLSSDLRRSHQGRIRDNGQLSVDFIAAGIPVEQLSSQYHLSSSAGNALSENAIEVQLQTLQASLLGGQLNISPVTLTEALQTRSVISLEKIKLSEVLALEQQEGLNGEGLLSGKIPLEITNDGLRVTDGRLRNLDSGWIRYQPTEALQAVARSNSGLQTALKALENLHYQQLDIGLNYQPDGSTRLNTRLQGHNPDWNNAQPIDFTINIEENLLQLIKALQYTNKLTRSLEKRYR